MFTRHRLGPTNKLDCPHAMGTNAFSRIMIPRLSLRLRSGLRQSRDFGSGLSRSGQAPVVCHGCKPTNFGVRVEHPHEHPHPKIAKSAILEWGTRLPRSEEHTSELQS